MNKIFYYELKRMLLGKVFPGMLLVNALYAWFILSSETIQGVSCTAPFSAWSYCSYLGRTLPLAVITVLLLLANFYSRQQRRVEVLTDATPIPVFRQIEIRTLAAGVCFLVIYLVVIALALFFYACFFRFYDFAAFVLPSAVILLPCFVFFAGVGQLLGSLHQSLIYGLMLLAFALNGIPNVFDVSGAGYFSEYPLTLPVGADMEPAFTLSAGFLAVRLLYLALGTAGVYLAAVLSARKSQNA